MVLNETLFYHVSVIFNPYNATKCHYILLEYDTQNENKCISPCQIKFLKSLRNGRWQNFNDGVKLKIKCFKC